MTIICFYIEGVPFDVFLHKWVSLKLQGAAYFDHWTVDLTVKFHSRQNIYFNKQISGPSRISDKGHSRKAFCAMWNFIYS